MPKMPVMEAAVKILESEGVDVCFGIPGAAILPLYKALSKSTKIKHLTMRHEEGASCLAVPVLNAQCRVEAALSVSGPSVRMTPKRLRTLVPFLRSLGGELSARLGFGPLRRPTNGSA